IFTLQDLRGGALKRRFACGSKVLLFYLFFVFSLAERKNEKQKEDKVPLRTTISEVPRKSYHFTVVSDVVVGGRSPALTPAAPSCQVASAAFAGVDSVLWRSF